MLIHLLQKKYIALADSASRELWKMGAYEKWSKSRLHLREVKKRWIKMDNVRFSRSQFSELSLVFILCSLETVRDLKVEMAERRNSEIQDLENKLAASEAWLRAIEEDNTDQKEISKWRLEVTNILEMLRSKELGHKPEQEIARIDELFKAFEMELALLKLDVLEQSIDLVPGEHDLNMALKMGASALVEFVNISDMGADNANLILNFEKASLNARVAQKHFTETSQNQAYYYSYLFTAMSLAFGEESEQNSAQMQERKDMADMYFNSLSEEDRSHVSERSNEQIDAWVTELLEDQEKFQGIQHAAVQMAAHILPAVYHDEASLSWKDKIEQAFSGAKIDALLEAFNLFQFFAQKNREAVELVMRLHETWRGDPEFASVEEKTFDSDYQKLEVSLSVRMIREENAERELAAVKRLQERLSHHKVDEFKSLSSYIQSRAAQTQGKRKRIFGIGFGFSGAVKVSAATKVLNFLEAGTAKQPALELTTNEKKALKQGELGKRMRQYRSIWSHAVIVHKDGRRDMPRQRKP